MSVNGLEYIKLNGVDITEDVYECEIKETMSESECTIKTQTEWLDDYTFSPFNSVLLVKSSDNELAFTGVIYNTDNSFDKSGIKTHVLKAIDMRKQSQNYPVRIRFMPDTSCKQAIQTLITGYFPSHELGTTPDILESTICDLDFNGETFQEVIETILALTEDEILWNIDYNESTAIYTHNFTTAFTSSVGTYNKVDISSKEFKIDYPSIKNSIHLSSGEMIMNTKCYQTPLYFQDNQDYSLELDGSLDVLFIPFEHEPAGAAELHLLIGNKATPSTIANCSRVAIGVEPEDPDNPFYEHDIRRNLVAANPDYTANIMEDFKAEYKDIGLTSGATGINIGEQVYQGLIGRFTPKFMATHYTKSIPELPSSIYGYLACRSKIYLVNNLDYFNKVMKTRITKEQLLGYQLIYPYKSSYSRVFTDETSITDYGRRHKGEGKKNFRSLSTFKLYGEALLAKFKTPEKKGSFTIKYYEALTDTYDNFPVVGSLCDVNPGYTVWNETDVQIRSVEHRINNKEWRVTISANKRPKLGHIEALLKKIRATDKQGNTNITTEVTVTDSIDVDDGSVSLTIYSADDMVFDEVECGGLIYE